MDYRQSCDFCFRPAVAMIRLHNGWLRTWLGLPNRQRYVCAKCFRRRGLRR